MKPFFFFSLEITFFWRSLHFGRKKRSNSDEELFFVCLEITCFWPEKPLKFWWRPFFFVFFLEITWFRPEKPFQFRWRSFFGPNRSTFSVYFGLHKTRIPSYLSFPRAHVRFSAPLEGGCNGVWGRTPQPLKVIWYFVFLWRSKILCFFGKNNLIIGLFWQKLMPLNCGIEISRKKT